MPHPYLARGGGGGEGRGPGSPPGVQADTAQHQPALLVRRRPRPHAPHTQPGPNHALRAPAARASGGGCGGPNPVNGRRKGWGGGRWLRSRAERPLARQPGSALPAHVLAAPVRMSVRPRDRAGRRAARPAGDPTCSRTGDRARLGPGSGPARANPMENGCAVRSRVD
jgi:hypothetical protein